MHENRKAKQTLKYREKDIAVIGMACRYPGASDYEEYWKNILDGTVSIKKIPADRWNVDETFDTYNKEDFAGLLEKYKDIDSSFFNLSPREAETMDPQQRLMLMEAWHCMEDSGVPLSILQKKRTSVIVGVTGNDYSLQTLTDGEDVDSYAALGNFTCMVANRVSHMMGLCGTSFTIDTACSSSLVAIHQARHMLESGESDFAFAGGVCAAIHPWRHTAFSKSHMLSPTGRCGTFDEDANGFILGEGVGVLLLQRLEDAVKSNNNIYGIIKGSAVNHCGKSLTVTSPSVTAQEDVILSALSDADVNPETVGYIEAHGTGTSLGDPIEFEALTRAFGKFTGKKQFCRIGSSKPNIGHTGSAAGVAGVIKTLLMMKNKKIPGLVSMNAPNPVIDPETSPFKLEREAVDWNKTEDSLPRRAGVSAFGFGGVNAHLILEEWNDCGRLNSNRSSRIKNKSHLFVLSAKSQKSLADNIEKWKNILREDKLDNAEIGEICATLLCGRVPFEYRFGGIVSKTDDIKQLIDSFETIKANDSNKGQPRGVKSGLRLHIGGIAQVTDKITSEISEYKVFKESFKTLKKEIKNNVYGGNLSKNAYSLIYSYYILSVLMKLGFKPDTVSCYGTGYWLGLAICGVISLKDVLSIYNGDKKCSDVKWSRPLIPLYNPAENSYIYSVKLKPEQINELFGGLRIPREALEYYLKKARALLKNQHSFIRNMAQWQTAGTRYGFDVSAIIKDDKYIESGTDAFCAEKLIAAVAVASAIRAINRKWKLSEHLKADDVRFKKILDLISGKVMTPALFAGICAESLNAEQAVHLMNERLSNTAVGADYRLFKDAADVVDEIDDKDEWLNKCIEDSQHDNQTFAKSGLFVLREGVSEDLVTEISINSRNNMEKSMLALWLNGADINWNLLYPDADFYKMRLPVYSFDTTDYFYKPKRRFGTAVKLHPMIDANISTFEEIKFKKTIHIGEFFIKDHVVDGKNILPGTAYLEFAFAAGSLSSDKKVKVLKDIVWANPFVMESESKDIYISLSKMQGYVSYKIYSFSDFGEKVLHSEGKLVYEDECGCGEPRKFNIKEIKARCGFKITEEECYGRVFSKTIGFDYGPAFRLTQLAFGGETESLERLKLPERLENGMDSFFIHPSIMDAALRAVTWIGGQDAYKKLKLHIPFSLGRVEVLGKLAKDCFSYASIVPETSKNESGSKRFNISVADKDGVELVRMYDFTIRRLKGSAGQKIPGESGTIRYRAAEWVKAALAAPEEVSAAGAALVFDDDEQRAAVISKYLEDRFGCTACRIKSGKMFYKRGKADFIINRLEEEDYKKLCAAVSDKNGKITHIVNMWNMGSDGSTAMLQEPYGWFDTTLYPALFIFKTISSVLPDKRVQYVSCSGEGGLPAAAAETISAFAKSVSVYNHKIEIINLLIGKSYKDSVQIAQMLCEELAQPAGSHSDAIYRNSPGTGGRFIKSMHEFSYEPHEIQPKKNGVYIITGGTGALGLLTAEFIHNKYNAAVVLVGRSKPNEKAAELIRRCGNTVLFVKCDISSLSDTVAMVRTVREKFGRVDGVIHCAGVTDQIPVADADKSCYEKVLAPKAFGAVNLDIACADDNLDFFVLYSSAASQLGDYGRGSYAAANRFLDAFAAFRDNEVKVGKRHGQTVSIDWPLWKNGGMKAYGTEKKIYSDYLGMAEIDDAGAFDALEFVLKCGKNNVAVTCGRTEGTDGSTQPCGAAQNDSLKQKEKNIISAPLAANQNEIFKKAESYIKEIFAKVTKVPLDDISIDVPTEKYGINSIVILELNDILDKHFDSLPRTLFFEYENLRGVIGYLVKNDPEDVAKMIPSCTGDSLQRHMIQKDGIIPSLEQAGAGIEPTQAADQTGCVDVPGRGDIAVIGLSGRYPQADNLKEFWDNLANGRDCITEIPDSRFDWRKYYDPQKGKKGKIYSKWGGFIRDFDKFDPLFFNISPNEAKLIDPQERLFLETVYETLEDAGYTRSALDTSKVGVFVGVMNYQYQLFGAEELMKGNMMDVRSSVASVANRVSYFFNFKGPSIGVDTMCSSSLTAIHLACRSLLENESDVAVAGGVNLILHPAKYVFLSEQRFGSSEGKCRAFGEGGDGYVPAEGVGAVLLKPLEKAVADNDRIYGVIKATAINHGGKTNGYTVPNPGQQSKLISTALERSGINPETVTYVEAHGTGTALGDPIEVAALSKAFEKYTGIKQFSAIGSVKANIGHAESAAGIASLTKVLLMMRYKKIVPSILADTPNKNIDFKNSPFYIQKTLKEWEQPFEQVNGAKTACPRRAGISSFGAGGTNVHIIVEEYPQKEKNEDFASVERLFVISAKTQKQLKEYAKRIAAFINHDVSGTCRCESRNHTITEQKLASAAAEILCVETTDLNIKENLTNCGFGAVEFLRFTHEINRIFDIDFMPETVSEYGDIRAIAESVDKELQNKGAEKKICGINLESLAFTLSVGREQMNERLAVIALSANELANALSSFAFDTETGGRVFYGGIPANSAYSMPDMETMERFEPYFSKGEKLEKLAAIWVSGANIDWKYFYEGKAVDKIGLPFYPFNKDRFWIPVSKNKINAESPLIDCLDVRFSLDKGIAYTKRFTGLEIYLENHVIKGRKILPGVCHMEMAYEAAKRIFAGRTFQLEQVAFAKPLVCDCAQEVVISLQKDGKAIHYKIMGREDSGSDVYSMGSICEADENGRPKGPLSLKELMSKAERRIGRDEIYDILKNTDICYGPFFRSIDSLWIGGDETLVQISVPTGYESESEKYELCPAILDAALQSISLSVLYEGSKETFLPYSINSFRLFKKLTARTFAHVKRSEDAGFDITITDDGGNVLALIDGISVRRLKDPYEGMLFTTGWVEADEKTSIDTPSGNTLILYKEEETALAEKIARLCGAENAKMLLLGKHSRILAGNRYEADISNKGVFDGLLHWIGRPDTVYFLGGIDRCGECTETLKNLENSHINSIISFFRLVKSFMAAGLNEKSMTIKVISNDLYRLDESSEVKPFAAALRGFAQTLQKEQPNWHVISMDVAGVSLSAEEVEDTAKKIVSEDGQVREESVVLRGDARYESALFPLTLNSARGGAFRQGGVYFIVGGAGGIGLVLSKYLASRYKAGIVLTGRGGIDENKRKNIAEIERLGGKVKYIKADVCSENDMTQAVAAAKSCFGQINGVIHSAVVLKDMAIWKMSEEELTAVIDPKAKGSVILDRVFNREPLDFMLFFSSMESVLCNPGQSNYAAACMFKDAYATHIADKRSYKVKVINWGYFSDFGVAAGDEYKKIMSDMGVYPISADQLAPVVEAVLLSDERQVVVVRASDRMLKKMGFAGADADRKQVLELKEPEMSGSRREEETYNSGKTGNLAAYPQGDVLKFAEEIIKSSIVGSIGISPEDLDAARAFSEYGVDSITGIDIVNRIGAELGFALKTTVLFDYGDVGRLAGYLCQRFGAQLKEKMRARAAADGKIVTGGGSGSKAVGGLDALMLLAKGELSVEDAFEALEGENETI